MPVTQWSTEAVLAALRAGAKSKEELQGSTGIGPTDLRNTVEALVGDGVIGETETGWEMLDDPGDGGLEVVGTGAEAVFGPGVWEPPEEAGGGLPPAPASREPEAAEAATAGAPGAEGLHGPSGSSRGLYQARLSLEVSFYPEPEHGTDDVTVAYRDAEGFREAALAGVLERWPDLSVGGRVEELIAFSAPVRVWPPDAR